MRTVSRDDFKFFVPVDITKSKDGAGKEIMKIGGIASTKERDTDNEILDPNGFDLSYFLKSGFINWHHRAKDDPSAIIGEPTSAKITTDGLYFEGILYPDSDLANKVYKLAKDMEKSGSGRKLGFSIEGKVVERDAIDERFVKKAKVTGIAVTPTPKNAGTWLNILKGEFSNDEDEFDTTSSNLFNGGKVELIVDILKPDGERVTVDKDFNIKIVAKGLDTTSGAPLVKEDVEKVVHNQVGADTGKKHKKDFLVSKDLPTFDTTIKKSQAFLLLSNYVSDFEKAKIIYKEIEKSINSQAMKGNNITVSDEVANALKKFGLDPIDFEKGAEDELQKAKKIELKKAIDTKKKELADMQAEFEGTDEGGSKREKAPEESGSDDEEEDEMGEDEMGEDGKPTGKKVKKKKVEKSHIDQEWTETTFANFKPILKKAVIDDFSKGLEIVKSHYENLERANKVEFEKGISEIKDLVLGLQKSQSEFQESVIERVEAVENAKPEPKSFTSEDVKGKTELSIRDRYKVSSVLMAKAGIEKGEINDFYANAVSLYEATGQISKAISDDLFANSNIVFTN